MKKGIFGSRKMKSATHDFVMMKGREVGNLPKHRKPVKKGKK